ncbi:hypothetical protein [Haladaptatus salinisoli]|uniref:hypothetical protein n=1 Tax=Haladaptatus salinisoli TaxID=2884876 RepID=UPI001D0BA543|nr:hypothetical protein [Haladaptatus salinisoli]
MKPKSDSIYKVTPLNRKGNHISLLESTWKEHGLISVTDGGISSSMQLITSDDTIVSEKVIATKATAPFEGTFEWKFLRDMMIRPDGILEPIPRHYAAKVAGSIIRFVEDLCLGTIILANFDNKSVPGIVTGPCRYRSSSALTNVAPTHVFQRDVRWLDPVLKNISINEHLLDPHSNMVPIKELSVSEALCEVGQSPKSPNQNHDRVR